MDTLHGPPTPQARLTKLLLRIKRLAQLFGQLSEDEICRLRAGISCGLSDMVGKRKFTEDPFYDIRT